MKVITTLCLTAALSLSCISATAQVQIPQSQQQHALRLNVGHQSRYTRIELAYETPTLWQGSIFKHPIDLKVEASLAYWDAHNVTLARKMAHPHSNASLWQIGITPMLRWWVNAHWYVEGGIGLNLMNHTQFVNQKIGSSFQFGDHIGIVRTFGDNWRVGLRMSHFSNASIKSPNNGLNIFQLTLSRTF